MDRARRCPQCGAALPADAPEGPCARCLPRLAAPGAGRTSDPPGEAADATQGEPGPTAPYPHPAEPHEEPVPPQIGRYRILRRIGAGGMGTVYEAEQERPRRTVALKVLRPSAAGRRMLRRFAHEAEALGRLQHPGIARIYESGVAESAVGPRPFFAMELVCGPGGRKAPCLTEHAEQQRLDTRRRLELVAGIADAVHYAHQKGVIHRDLKPANILVDERGQPKVLDFGVARLTDQDIRVTTTQTDVGQIIGTLPYMSPEQAAGDPAELDTRSDVYALGVICYELLSGRLPYRLGQQMIHEAVRVIQQAEPTRLSSISRAFRGDIETIVAKSLAKEKERRYQSAAELAADIRRYLRDEPIVARPPSTWYQLGKFAKRNKALVAGAAGVFAALVLGMIGTSVGLVEARRAQRSTEAARRRETVQRQRAVEAQARAERGELAARMWLYASRIEQAQRDLADGRTGRALSLLAAERSPSPEEDLRSFEWYYLWRRCHEGHRATLRTYRERVNCVAFSPDDKQLACGSSDGMVTVWDLATGRAHTFRDAGGIMSLAFSPNGRFVASGSSAGTVGLWHLADGPAPLPRAGHTGAVQVLAFSAGGEELASWGADGACSLWRLPSGEQRAHLGGRSHMGCGVLSPDGRNLAFLSGLRIRDGNAAGSVVRESSIVCVVSAVPGDSAGRPTTAPTRPSEPREIELPRAAAVLLAVSNDATHAALADWSGRDVQVWDLRAAALQAALGLHPDRISCAAFSPDGKALAAASDDGSIWLWDVAARKARHHAHSGGASWLAFSHDGNTLASAGRDGAVRLWDAGPRPAPRPDPRQVPFTEPRVLEFTPDGRMLGTIDQRGQFALWEVATGRLRAALTTPGAQAGFGASARERIAFSPDSATAAAARRHDPNVVLWDVQTGRVKATLSGHVKPVYWVAFSPAGKVLASASTDGAIKVWDLARRSQLATLEGDGAWRPLLFSPDGRTLAFGRGGRTVVLWSPATGAETGRLAVEGRGACPLAFSRDGRALAIMWEDPTEGRPVMGVWDVATGRQRDRYEVGPPRPSLGEPFSTVERIVAFVPRSGMYLLDTATGPKLMDVGADRPRAHLAGEAGSLRGVAWSRDAAVLAGLGDDGSITIWDAATGRRRATFRDAAQQSKRIALSSDGRTLAAVGRDGKLRFWRTADEADVRAQGPLFDPREAPARRATAEGEWLRQRERHAEAVQAYRRAVELYEQITAELPEARHCLRELSVARYGLAKALAAAGEAEEAEQAVRRTIELAPAEAEAHAALARYLADGPPAELRRPREAAAHARRAIELARGDPRHHETLAVACYRAGEPRAALAALGQGLGLGWQSGWARFLAAMARWEAAQRHQARDAYDRAVTWMEKHAPRDAEALRFRAEAAALLGLPQRFAWPRGVRAGPEGTAACLSFSADGAVLAAASIGPRRSRWKVAVWDERTGEVNAEVEAPLPKGADAGELLEVALAPGGERVAVARGDGAVELWDVKGPKKLAQGRCPPAERPMAFSPDGKLLVFASGDKAVTVWDAATGAERTTFAAHRLRTGPDAGVGHLAFAPDGGTLASVCLHEVKLWETATWRQRARFTLGSLYTCVALGPGGKLLAVGTDAGDVDLYDTAGGARRRTLRGLGGDGARMAFSPDGRTLAAWSTGGAGLWAVATGRLLADVTLHSNTQRWCSALAFSPDGRRLALAYNDGTLQLWNLLTEALAGEGPAAEQVGPAYEPKGPLTPVDLPSKANQKLTEKLHSLADNDLAELPRGRQTFAGVTFEVADALLQLRGRRIADRPERIEAIPVGRAFATLYVLHGTGWSTGEGALVGYYRVNYADGSAASVPILYGCDVRDWWTSNDLRGTARGAVGWVGRNACTRKEGGTVRLYVSAWANPHPGRKVATIDFVSTNTTAAPFCVAMTVE